MLALAAGTNDQGGQTSLCRTVVLGENLVGAEACLAKCNEAAAADPLPARRCVFSSVPGGDAGFCQLDTEFKEAIGDLTCFDVVVPDPDSVVEPTPEKPATPGDTIRLPGVTSWLCI